MDKYSSAFIGTVEGAGESGYWDLWYEREDGFTYGPIARGNGNGAFRTGWITTNIKMRNAFVVGAGYVATLDQESLNVPNKATVSTEVSSGSGTIGGCGEFNVGDTCTPTFTPASGYVLDYWTLDNVTRTTGFEVWDNCKVRAYFKVAAYRIYKADGSGTFAWSAPNGTTIRIDKVTYIYPGTTVTLEAHPGTGYELDYWTLDGVVQSGMTFTMPSKDVSIFFAYRKKSYVITNQNDSHGSVTVAASATYGSTVNVSFTPGTGYSFDYWTLDGTKQTGTSFTMPAANVTVKGFFKKNSYNITNQNDGNGTVTVAASALYDTSVGVSLTPNTGYSADYWTLDNVKQTGNSFTMPAKNVTVKGFFKRNSYTITKQNDGHGSVSVASSALYKDTVSVSFTPNTGYKFDYWTLDGTRQTGNSFEMPAQNVIVKGFFAKNVFKLTLGSYVTAKSGSKTIASGTEVTYGTTVTLKSSARTGYTFSHFVLRKADGTQYGNNISDGGSFDMPAQALSVEAVYTHNTYSITGSVSPNGAGTLTLSKSTAYYEDEITLSTAANEGYIFAYFTSSPQVTITNNKFRMPAANVTITAVFYRRSTATLDKSTYTGGDTAVLTISMQSNTFKHKYLLDFGFGMVGEVTDVAAGVSSVNIYIPLAWSRMMASTPKSGGKLTLWTYAGDGTYVGTYEITGLSYAALDGTIPKLTVFRAKENGAYIQNGLRAGYRAAYPASTTAKLICGNDQQNNPAASGFIMPNNKRKFALEETQIVELEITYGAETFRLKESVPAVRLVQKKVNVTVVSS